MEHTYNPAFEQAPNVLASIGVNVAVNVVLGVVYGIVRKLGPGPTTDRN